MTHTDEQDKAAKAKLETLGVDDRISVLLIAVEKLDEHFRRLVDHVNKANLPMQEDINRLNRWMKAATPVLDEAADQAQAAYYHIFPERRAQDARFREQLKSLINKSSPDASPNKE